MSDSLMSTEQKSNNGEDRLSAMRARLNQLKKSSRNVETPSVAGSDADDKST